MSGASTQSDLIDARKDFNFLPITFFQFLFHKPFRKLLKECVYVCLIYFMYTVYQVRVIGKFSLTQCLFACSLHCFLLHTFLHYDFQYNRFKNRGLYLLK